MQFFWTPAVTGTVVVSSARLKQTAALRRHREQRHGCCYLIVSRVLVDPLWTKSSAHHAGVAQGGKRAGVDRVETEEMLGLAPVLIGQSPAPHPSVPSKVVQRGPYEGSAEERKAPKTIPKRFHFIPHVKNDKTALTDQLSETPNTATSSSNLWHC